MWDDRQPQEILELQDQIISTTLLLIVQIYLLKKTNFHKASLHEKVAQNDLEKKKWLEMVCENLSANKVLLQETYLTLMLISLNKSQI